MVLDTCAHALCTDVMDVYVDKKQRVWLVDFGVFGGTTDPLLFSWSALLHREGEVTADASSATGEPVDIGVTTIEVDTVCGAVPLKLVSRPGIRPKPLMRHQVPDDFFGAEFEQCLHSVRGAAADDCLLPPEADGKSAAELVDMLRAAGCH